MATNISTPRKRLADLLWDVPAGEARVDGPGDRRAAVADGSGRFRQHIHRRGNCSVDFEAGTAPAIGQQVDGPDGRRLLKPNRGGGSGLPALGSLAHCRACLPSTRKRVI